MSLPSILTNIIMPGNINLPNRDRSCLTISCPMASPLTDLAGLLFLNQQVKETIRFCFVFVFIEKICYKIIIINRQTEIIYKKKT